MVNLESRSIWIERIKDMKEKTYSLDEVLELLNNETHHENKNNVYFHDTKKTIFLTKNWYNAIAIRKRQMGYYSVLDISRDITEHMMNIEYYKIIGSHPWIE